MTYEETIEIEENIKLKNQANEIYQSFLNNIKLEPKNYKGEGRFVIDQDQHNSTYIRLDGDKFILQCRFLHESYDCIISPAHIFTYLKNKYRGVEHLASYVRNKKD